ncbi:transcription factor Sox-3-like [Eleutherodactylus coqui]|uniref:transcription factor Sox-3-like n=1 Tax=Eleutherodactylus coqui TaxID=57060 RepID=UPI0034620065
MCAIVGAVVEVGQRRLWATIDLESCSMSKMMGINLKSPLKSQAVGDGASVIEDNTATVDEDKAQIVKRPMNAYMIWYMHRRGRLAAIVPRLSVCDISKLLGLEWRHLSDAEKKPFQDEAKRLKAELHSKYPNYKFKPKQKLPASQTKDSYSLPVTSTASDANSSSGTFLQKSNGPYGLVLQQPGPSSSQVQALPRYDLNRLCFNHMPSAAAYLDSSSMYNIPAPCNHYHPILMAMGSIVPGVKLGPPIIASLIPSGYLTDMTGMYAAPSGNGNDPSGFQNSIMPRIHPLYQAVETAENGNVYQNDIWDENDLF